MGLPGWLIFTGYLTGMGMFVWAAPASAGLTRPIPTLVLYLGSALAVTAWSLIYSHKLMPLSVLGFFDSTVVALVAFVIGVWILGEAFTLKKALLLGGALCLVLAAHYWE